MRIPEALRLRSEQWALRLLVGQEGLRVRDAAGNYGPAVYHREALAGLEALARVGVFNDQDAERWRRVIEAAKTSSSAAEDPAERHSVAEAYLLKNFAALAETAPREAIASLGSALDALLAVEAIDDEEYFEWLDMLQEHVPAELRPEGRYLATGPRAYVRIIAKPVEAEEGVPDSADLLPPGLREASRRPAFSGRELERVVPGPVRAGADVTLTAAELCTDGVLIHWHRLRPVAETPPDHGEGPPPLEFFAQLLGFQGDKVITGLRDAVGTEYALASGAGGSGWDASRPRFQDGSTAFVPRVPEAATRLEVVVGGRGFRFPLGGR